jgi:hypothetical protein
MFLHFTQQKYAISSWENVNITWDKIIGIQTYEGTEVLLSAFLTLALEEKCQASLFTLMEQASYPLDILDRKTILDIVKRKKFH